MRSFLNRVMPAPAAATVVDAAAAGELLGRAEGILQQLRTGDAQNFPQLNEATRLVQEVEGAVMRMSEADPMKPVWREQVGELQKALQAATTHMLSAETRAGAPPATSQFAAAHTSTTTSSPKTNAAARSTQHGAAPLSARVPSPGGSMFDGLTLESGISGTAPVPAPERAPLAGGSRSSSVLATPVAAHDVHSGAAAWHRRSEQRREPFAPPALTPSTSPAAAEPAIASSGGECGMFSGMDLVFEEAAGSASADAFRAAVHLQSAPSAEASDGGMSVERQSISQAATEAQGGGNSTEQLTAGAIAELLSSTMSPSSGLESAASSNGAGALRTSAQPPGGASPANSEEAGARRRRACFRVGYARGTAEDDNPGGPPLTLLTGRAGSGGRQASGPLDAANFGGASAEAPGRSTHRPLQHDTAPSPRRPLVQSAQQSPVAQHTPAAPRSASQDSASALHAHDAAHLRASSSNGSSTVHAISAMGPPPTHAAVTLGPRPPADTISQLAAVAPFEMETPMAAKASAAGGHLGPARSGTASQNAFDEALGFGGAQLEAAPASLFESGLQGHSWQQQSAMVEQRLHCEQERLSEGLHAAAEAEQQAKHRWRRLLEDCSAAQGEQLEVQRREEAAVEAEDFEAAASLSARLDQLSSRVLLLAVDVRSAEVECEATSARRVHAAAQQAVTWERAAATLQALGRQQRSDVAQLADRSKAALAAAAAEEAAEQLRLKQAAEACAARREALTERAEELHTLTLEASAPMAPRRDAAEAARHCLQQEVEDLRAQLAEVEGQLEGAISALDDIGMEESRLTAAFDDELGDLNSQQADIAEEEGGHTAALVALAAVRRVAAKAEAAAEVDRARLLQQAHVAVEAATAFEAEGAAIRSRISSQQRSQQLLATLRLAESSAAADLQGLEAQAEVALSELRQAASRAAMLQQQAAAAEERAAAARQRLPQLEALKKAAAAARDFKEAARLSTEVKALAADTASAAEGAAALATELVSVSQRESLQREEVALLDEALLEARRSAALAQWRRLQVMTSGAQQQLDAAIAAEAWEDAAALQEELSAAAQQSAALAAAHSFQALHAADLAPQLAPSAPGNVPGSALSSAQAAAEGNTATVPPSRESGERQNGKDTATAAGQSEEERPAGDNGAEARRKSGNKSIGALSPVVRLERAADPEHGAQEVGALGDENPGLLPSPSIARMEDGYASGSESSISEAGQPSSAPLGREVAPSAADVLAAQRVDSGPLVPPLASSSRLAAGYLADSDTSTSMMDTGAPSEAAPPAPETSAASIGAEHSVALLEAPGEATGRHMGSGASCVAEALLPSESQASLADGYAADSDASAQDKRHRPEAAPAPVLVPGGGADGKLASAAASLDDDSGAGSPLVDLPSSRQPSADGGVPLSAVEEEPLPSPPLAAGSRAESSSKERTSENATAADQGFSQALREGVEAEPTVRRQLVVEPGPAPIMRVEYDDLHGQAGHQVQGDMAGPSSGGMFAGMDLA